MIAGQTIVLTPDAMAVTATCRTSPRKSSDETLISLTFGHGALPARTDDAITVEISAQLGAARFVSLQNEYSLLHREPEPSVLPAAGRLGMAFLPYFPLASGLLTGKYDPGKAVSKDSRLSLSWTSRFTSERNVRIAEALKSFAAARTHTLLELAFSWLASRPQVASVIAGATSPEQVRANVAAANWSLTRDELAEIDRLAPPPA